MRSSGHSRRLVLVETAREARAAPADAHPVAVSPEAELCLEDLGRAFTPLDAHVEDGEIEAWGQAHFALTDELALAIDAAVRDAWPRAAQLELAAGTWQDYHLKIVVDALLLRARIVDRLVERLSPAAIVAFDRRRSAPGRDLVGLEGSLWFPAAAAVSERRGVGLTTQHVADRPPWRDLAAGTLAPAVARLRGVRDRARREPAAPPPSPGRGAKILLLDEAYSMVQVVPRLLQRAGTVWVWPGAGPVRDSAQGRQALRVPPPPMPALDEVWSAVARAPAVRAAFSTDVADLWPRAAPRLRRFLASGLREIALAAEGAEVVLDAQAPDLIMSSWAEFPRYKAIAAAARRRGIPYVLSRHGELGTRTNPHSARHDLDGVTDVLAWGEWEERWIARYGPTGIRTHRVGAPMVEAAVADAPARSTARRELGIHGGTAGVPLALYVPTSLSDNWWYASHRTPPDHSYFRQQRRLIGEVRRAGLRVLVKQHPFAARSAPLDRWVRERAPDGVTVIRRPGFDQLLHAADAVILDMPSTTLVQALFGSARIYIVDHPVLVWEPGVLEHLAAHGVTVCVTVDALHARLAADRAAGRLDQAAAWTEEARLPLAWSGAPHEPPTAAERAAVAAERLALDGAASPTT